MTLAEYDAWFLAFSEAAPCPTGERRSSLIRERVSEIDGVATSAAHFKARFGADGTALGHPFGFDPLRAMSALGRSDSLRLGSDPEDTYACTR